METIIFVPLIAVIGLYFLAVALCSLGVGAAVSWIFGHFFIISIILWGGIVVVVVRVAFTSEGIRGIFLRLSQLGLFFSSYLILFASLKEVSLLFEEKNVFGLILGLPLYIFGTPILAFVVQGLILCVELMIERPLEDKRVGLTVYSILTSILNVFLAGTLAVFVYFVFLA